MFAKIFEKKEPSPLIGSQISVIESPDLNFVQGSSLMAQVPPNFITPQVLGQLVGIAEPEARKDIIEYAVEPGDTITAIAEKFGISLNTLLWANDLNKKSTVKPGQKLTILPISGVTHIVKKGETISEIAKIHKGKIDEIIAFNELSSEGDIFIGDILIIPNGVLPVASKTSSPNLAPLASSFFICPIASPCKLTQGLHFSNAVDLSHGKCGEPVYSAAGGQIQRAMFGWNKGAGNYITILHPNGVVTKYYHLQSILVDSGENVSQGQIIALMGGQPGAPGSGNSTGCHLHFEVQGARNPFAK